VDLRGAARMRAWYFACEVASLFLNMHHSATAQEVSGLWRVAAAASVNAVPDALSSSMVFFFMLFLLRVLLRKQWIAATGFVAIMSVIPAIGSPTPWVDMADNALLFGVLAFVLLRFGLLASIVAFTSLDLLSACRRRWTSRHGTSAGCRSRCWRWRRSRVYGFRTSLAGRPLFQISGE